jgi:hypothetical protein
LDTVEWLKDEVEVSVLSEFPHRITIFEDEEAAEAWLKENGYTGFLLEDIVFDNIPDREVRKRDYILYDDDGIPDFFFKDSQLAVAFKLRWAT